MAWKKKPPVEENEKRPFDELDSRFFFLNDELPRMPALAAAKITIEALRGQGKKAADKAVNNVVRPGGDARGKQKSDAADKWRKPAAAHAEKIWQGSHDLPIAIVGQRIRKLLPEDKQPPSDRALKDHIRPLRPQK